MAGSLLLLGVGGWISWPWILTHRAIDQLGSGGFSKPGFLEPGPGDPEGQLYDLETDPGEMHNLYESHPEIVSRLQGELDQVLGITKKSGD